MPNYEAFCQTPVDKVEQVKPRQVKKRRLKNRSLKDKLLRSAVNGLKFGAAFGLGVAFCATALQALNHIKTEYDPEKTSWIAQKREEICLSRALAAERVAILLERHSVHLENELEKLKSLTKEKEPKKPIFEMKAQLASINFHCIKSHLYQPSQGYTQEELKNIYQGLSKDDANYAYCHCKNRFRHVCGTGATALVFYLPAITGVMSAIFASSTLTFECVKKLFKKIEDKVIGKKRKRRVASKTLAVSAPKVQDGAQN